MREVIPICYVVVKEEGVGLCGGRDVLEKGVVGGWAGRTGLGLEEFDYLEGLIEGRGWGGGRGARGVSGGGCGF